MALTPDQMTEYARKVISSYIDDGEYLAIGEVLSDELADLSDDDFDEACQQVDKAIHTATITVTWRPDAE